VTIEPEAVAAERRAVAACVMLAIVMVTRRIQVTSLSRRLRGRA
jgi:hypothetical protein